MTKILGFLSLAKLLTCSWVQICSWTVVHCGSLVVEHFCSFTVSHFCRDGTKGQSNIFKRVFLFFDLFVDGLSDGVALLLRSLLALRLVLRAAHTVLHGLALLPAQDKDIMRQQFFFYIMLSSFRGSWRAVQITIASSKPLVPLDLICHWWSSQLFSSHCHYLVVSSMKDFSSDIKCLTSASS